MDFLGLGPLEILVVLVIILIIFGPMKLPEIAGQIGKTMREVRKATTEMTRQINQEVEAGKKGIEAIKSDIESAASPKAGPVANRPVASGAASAGASAASPKAQAVTSQSQGQQRGDEQR